MEIALLAAGCTCTDFTKISRKIGEKLFLKPHVVAPACCVCKTIFFFLFIPNLLCEKREENLKLCEILPQFLTKLCLLIEQDLARSGKICETQDKNWKIFWLWKCMIFIWAQWIRRTEKKLMWRKKIFSFFFFNSESANLS